MKPPRLKNDNRGASLVEYGLLSGLIAVAAIVAVDRTGGSVANLFDAVDAELRTVRADLAAAPDGPAATPGPADPDASCEAIRQAGLSTGDGVYTIDPDGDGAGFAAYCDMTSLGGGWTMVVAVYDDATGFSWTSGTRPAAPDLSTQSQFALAESDIPGHQQVAFGRDLDADAVDATTVASGFVYTTGDIPTALVTGASGTTYQIHRDAAQNFINHDPEDSLTTSSHAPALTFDATGGAAFSWAVAGGQDAPRRGFAIDGDDLRGSTEAFAWTVWVR